MLKLSSKLISFSRSLSIAYWSWTASDYSFDIFLRYEFSRSLNWLTSFKLFSVLISCYIFTFLSISVAKLLV